MPGSTARVNSSAAVKLTAIICSTACSLKFVYAMLDSMPALLTRMSTGPISDSTRSISALRSAAIATSAGIAAARTPSAATASRVASSSVSERAASATLTPRCASAFAMWTPIPREAPVTRAVAPLISFMTDASFAAVSGRARREPLLVTLLRVPDCDGILRSSCPLQSVGAHELAQRLPAVVLRSPVEVTAGSRRVHEHRDAQRLQPAGLHGQRRHAGEDSRCEVDGPVVDGNTVPAELAGQIGDAQLARPGQVEDTRSAAPQDRAHQCRRNVIVVDELKRNAVIGKHRLDQRDMCETETNQSGKPPLEANVGELLEQRR